MVYRNNTIILSRFADKPIQYAGIPLHTSTKLWLHCVSSNVSSSLKMSIISANKTAGQAGIWLTLWLLQTPSKNLADQIRVEIVLRPWKKYLHSVQSFASQAVTLHKWLEKIRKMNQISRLLSARKVRSSSGIKEKAYFHISTWDIRNPGTPCCYTDTCFEYIGIVLMYESLDSARKNLRYSLRLHIGAALNHDTARQDCLAVPWAVFYFKHIGKAEILYERTINHSIVF